MSKNNMAVAIRIELMIKASKTSVLPLHQATKYFKELHKNKKPPNLFIDLGGLYIN